MKHPQSLFRPALVLLVAVALAAPAMAGDQVPFQGTFTGDSTLVSLSTVDFPILHQTVAWQGVATHLGRFTWTSSIVFDVSPFFNPGTGNVLATGFDTWTAANGDQIYTSEEGELILPAATRVITQYVVLGGTGRFEGATGSFTSVFDIAIATVEGTISSPGSNKK
jgi:hypothetical protein